MARILGLDIGINSIGWALAEDDKKLIASGVRIFPVGVKEDDYNKSGSEISKNAARRDARTARRSLYRYKLRRKKLIAILQELGMMPVEELIKLQAKELYGLRKKGLDEKITLLELGRIFLLLNQRRGFKSSKKDKGSKENIKERSEMKLSMLELERKVKENNCRTIGEYFYLLFLQNSEDPNCYNPQQPIERVRKRFVERKLYEIEFDLLWQTQSQYYPQLLTEENKKKVKNEAIFYQRPLKSQKHLVGRCQFEKNKKCSPVSSYAFQEFRIWQKLNDIRITAGNRIGERLTYEEKQKIFEKLNKVEELSEAKIKEAAGLSKQTHFNDIGNKLKGNTTYARIAKAIGEDKFNQLSAAKREQLWHWLFFATDEEWLVEHSLKDGELNLTEEEAIKYASIQLEEGYSSISTKSLLKGKYHDVFENGILYHVKKGLGYTEACKEAGYHHSADETLDEWAGKADKIIIEPKEHLRNPLVQQCLSESARIVNAIINRYGKPDLIRVEMTRSLKKPKQEREQLRRKSLDTEKRREEYRDFLRIKLNKEYVTKAEIQKFELFLEMQYSEDDLKKLNGRIDIEEFKKFSKNIKSSDKDKYHLWLECGRISPYTGKVISLSELFSPEIEVEHIVPYSKCMDDSFMNKTLAEKSINELKGNRIPFEYLGRDKSDWEAFKDRVQYFPPAKQKQFLLQEIPGDFLNSQLSNSAYVAKEVIKHFRKVCKNVRVTNGQATAYLRKFWGLNDLLNPDGNNEKSRHDHRHHAIDAIVIAFTNNNYINLLSQHAQFDYLGKMRVEGIKFPYQSFKLDVNEHLSKMAISYRNKKRLLTAKKNKYTHSKTKVTPQTTWQIRGPLHKETNYGLIENPYTKESDYVVRQPITWIDNETKISKIVDKAIREIIRKKVDEKNGKIKEALAEPLFMTSRTGKLIPIKSVRVTDNAENLIQLRPKENPKLFVASGNNYCIAFYEGEDKKREFETVTFYDAVVRARRKESLVPASKNNKNLLFSLQQKDLVIIYENHPDEVNWNDQKELFKRLFRVIKFDVTGQIFFGRHNISNIDTKKDRNINLLQQRHSTLRAIKVYIDVLGTIKKA